MKFDGFKSVIEMLKCTDKAFQEKIIHGISKKDPILAKKILEEMKKIKVLKKQEKHVKKPKNIRSYGSIKI